MPAAFISQHSSITGIFSLLVSTPVVEYISEMSFELTSYFKRRTGHQVDKFPWPDPRKYGSSITLSQGGFKLAG